MDGGKGEGRGEEKRKRGNWRSGAIEGGLALIDTVCLFVRLSDAKIHSRKRDFLKN